MNQYEKNPIIRARVANRLQVQKEGETLEELAKHIGFSEASVTPSALAEFERLTNMLIEETHRPRFARRAS